MDLMTDEPRVLADGLPSRDPRLDRARQWDERNRNFSIAELVAQAPPPEAPHRGRSWRAGPCLDQGAEGACVGFAFTGEYAADPVPGPGGAAELNRIAREVYLTARQTWPGADAPGEGTSILAGAKAAQTRGWFDEYRWGDPTRPVDELVTVLTHAAGDPTASYGPAVIGVDWFDGMYEPDPATALVEVSGPLVGGHAILVRGVILHPQVKGHRIDEPLFRWRNSWDVAYGHDGDGLIRASDLARVLGPAAEVCYPVRRHR